ncbi:MAG: nucleotidyltransferase domain-containing protein [Clostridia bacterium]|nr:nucleotidyltransferase domain-containing protein [Clostridia bacterium]
MDRKVIDMVTEITKKQIPAMMRDDVRKIILYGSCARGDYTEDSDVDVAILTDCDRLEAKKYGDDLDDLATRIGMDTFAIVNYVCLPYHEYQEKKAWYPYFINIERDGVLLYER